MLLETTKPSLIVLFSVGAGGNPESHLPLLTSLTEHGCIVVAPYFDRLVSPQPTSDALLLRARQLHLALEFIACPNLPIMGIGHSIGATMLIALAGGQVWIDVKQKLDIKPLEYLNRLVLLTPATGFFQAPGALDAVHIPIQIWSGTNDVITPPDQSNFLKQQLENSIPVDMRTIDGAGHFSFINTLPPQIRDEFPNRKDFLINLANEIQSFIVS
ncbi:alpha/beta hydrolase family protein [Fluviispira multicolorata]|uniref:Alpha/beta hydrolase n=1 Tax=Fluviispira multicolorata TaxID=2654512 RepID=A0A833JDG4_9BACT|nr:alpha/beta hydrolase [Fluviispira multicolorata]KAB8031873.1 alpha/beta hydrolase [Fluviispira multicolorata]